ncbi:MAG: sigma-70 family RNA polymerase sigma factor [Planctomycetes bacterium]|nr:sigma-70 family RNA polymerase sigma factor [Planctomycetota bacterium]
MDDAARPPDLVDDLFRHRYARMVSGLCRVLGPNHLDLAEDVVQEALARALRIWPAEGVPDQPDKWVFRVARNLAFDSLRRQKIATRVGAELQRWAEAEAAHDARGGEVREPHPIDDDTLRMLFLCTHPAVPPDARVPLILKNVCGFGVPAIARALLKKEATIAQRLTRAKARLQADEVQFVMPAEHELAQRLGTVHEVVYLLFNEGWRAHAGADLLRSDLIDEAVRLLTLLQETPAVTSHSGHALLALLLLLGARAPARTDRHGELLTLAQQDRSRWDRRWLACGFAHLRASLGGPTLTAYHCEARIASLHAIAETFADTDWQAILTEYDRLLQLAPSPVVRLNRAVAVGKVHGAAAGLRALDGLDDDPALDDYFLLGAVTAQLHWERGDHAAAAKALERALQQPSTEPERRLLERRLAACRRGDAPQPW